MIDGKTEKIIYSFLDYCKYKDAIFLADVLHNEENSETSVYLLGTCYHRAQRHSDAMNLLKDSKFRTPRIKFLLAKCYFDLNRFEDAELVIQDGFDKDGSLFDNVRKEYESEACFVLDLLGQIYLATGRKELVEDVFKDALKLNPLMWTVQQYFYSENIIGNPTEIFTLDMYNKYMARDVADKINDQANGCTAESLSKDDKKHLPEDQNKQETSEVLKKSEKCDDIGNENSGTAIIRSVATSHSDRIERLMVLLKDIGTFYHYANVYNSEKAIESFEKLDSRHKKSATILSKVGKLYVDVEDFEMAEKYFKLTLEIEPYRIEDMDTYSMVLRNFEKYIELSSLTDRLMDSDRLSWITWHAIGQYMCLEDKPECSYHYFKRAIQLDPLATQPYNIMGLQYLLNRETFPAYAYLFFAYVLEPKNYVSCFCMGMLHFEQKNYLRATEYFDKAFSLHPRNSIILCYKARNESFSYRYDSALSTINRGLIDPKSSRCKFERACIYYTMYNYKAALEDITDLIKANRSEPMFQKLAKMVCEKLGYSESEYISKFLDIESSEMDKNDVSDGMTATFNSRLYEIDEDNNTADNNDGNDDNNGNDIVNEDNDDNDGNYGNDSVNEDDDVNGIVNEDNGIVNEDNDDNGGNYGNDSVKDDDENNVNDDNKDINDDNDKVNDDDDYNNGNDN